MPSTALRCHALTLCDPSLLSRCITQPHLADLLHMLSLSLGDLMQVFNNTPDETAFFRLCLERADVTASLTMIQPPLIAYSLESPPCPVLLDVASLKPEAVLLLDCWFYIVVHAGASIAAWRGAGYQDKPEHAAFKCAPIAMPIATQLQQSRSWMGFAVTAQKLQSRAGV